MPAGPGGAREETSRNEEAISRKSRDDLGTFIGRSVTAGTRKKYDRHWSLWKEFLFTERGSEDPFLKGMTDKDKSATVAMFLMRRHEAGHRGKSATAVTAGVRLRFAQELESTDFLNASVIATMRHSCNLDPVELRIIRSAGRLRLSSACVRQHTPRHEGPTVEWTGLRPGRFGQPHVLPGMRMGF